MSTDIAISVDSRKTQEFLFEVLEREFEIKDIHFGTRHAEFIFSTDFGGCDPIEMRKQLIDIKESVI